MDITEARRPAILERHGTRFGFLAYASVGPEIYVADEERAGHAPMRAWTFYETADPHPGAPPRVVSAPNANDFRTMLDDVYALRGQCNVLVVSFHWGLHFAEGIIPDYCYEVARSVIDAGADLILGHGPHILKGAEIYRGKPIFYSLGNFSVEIREPTVIKALATLEKLYRFEGAFPIYPFPSAARATIIAKVLVNDGHIGSVSYIPCYVNEDAEPEIVTSKDSRGQEVYEYMRSISASEGLSVNYRWNDAGTEVMVSA